MSLELHTLPGTDHENSMAWNQFPHYRSFVKVINWSLMFFGAINGVWCFLCGQAEQAAVEQTVRSPVIYNGCSYDITVMHCFIWTPSFWRFSFQCCPGPFSKQWCLRWPHCHGVSGDPIVVMGWCYMQLIVLKQAHSLPPGATFTGME